MPWLAIPLQWPRLNAMSPRFSSLLLVLALALVSHAFAQDAASLRLPARERAETAPGSGEFVAVGKVLEWNPRQTALVICDMWDAHTWKMVAPEYEWAAFLVGGVVGAILMMSVFNWALIIFSSIGGAHLILRAVPADPAIASVILVALAVVGCLFQAKAFARKPAE